MGFQGETTHRIVSFLDEIGIAVRSGPVPSDTFLPGILVQSDTLVVDETQLRYPGDLLHEAAHLAVAEPGQRKALYNDVSKNAGDELAALAWSWAALRHLDLPPEVVFHPHGYKGASEWLIEHYGNGGDMGVPLLQWMDMTADSRTAEASGAEAFPHMKKWLRE